MHNSYFNGMILGYPQRFVESYCKDLPNKLSESQLRRGLNGAKDAFAGVLLNGDIAKDSLAIRLNRTRGISEPKWNFIKQFVRSVHRSI